MVVYVNVVVVNARAWLVRTGLGAVFVAAIVVGHVAAAVALVAPPLADSGRVWPPPPAPALLQDALGVDGRHVVFVVVWNARSELLDKDVAEEVEHCLWRRPLGLDQVPDLVGVVWAIKAPAEVAVGVHGVGAVLHDGLVVAKVVHQRQGLQGRHVLVVQVGPDCGRRLGLEGLGECALSLPASLVSARLLGAPDLAPGVASAVLGVLGVLSPVMARHRAATGKEHVAVPALLLGRHLSLILVFLLISELNYNIFAPYSKKFKYHFLKILSHKPSKMSKNRLYTVENLQKLT